MRKRKRKVGVVPSQVTGVVSKQQQIADVASVVPCTPPPIVIVSEGRNLWAVSDLRPVQNFWEPARPEAAGLAITRSDIHVYGYHPRSSPLPRTLRNVVARVGDLRYDGRELDVHVCASRSPAVFAGRKEDAIRSFRSMKTRYQHTDIAVIANCHFSDPYDSGDLQAIAREAIKHRPKIGAVAICDASYDNGAWKESVIADIAETEWVSAMFYSELPVAGWATRWDTSENRICDGVDLAEGAELEAFTQSRDEMIGKNEPYRLILRGRQGVIATGMANPALPDRITEVLRLISVLRTAGIPTDTTTISDYLNPKGRKAEVVQKTERILQSAKTLLGANPDGQPRIYQDKHGIWVHTLPIDLDAGGSVQQLQGYRWFALLSHTVVKMLDNK